MAPRRALEAVVVTRAELLELLTVERFAPYAGRRRMSESSRLDGRAVVVPVVLHASDLDEVTIARRRRELLEAADAYVDPDEQRRATRAAAARRRRADRSA